MTKRRCKAIKAALEAHKGSAPTQREFRRAKRLYVRHKDPVLAVTYGPNVRRDRVTEPPWWKPGRAARVRDTRWRRRQTKDRRQRQREVAQGGHSTLLG